MNKNNYSFLNSTNNSSDIETLKENIENLQNQNNKLQAENNELKKINKSLNERFNLLLNENDVLKNVKKDVQDFSDLSNFNNNENTLKEFFYLLVLTEKMKYLNLEEIWMIEPLSLYKEVNEMDLAFYEWSSYLNKRLSDEYEKINKTKVEQESYHSLINKLK